MAAEATNIVSAEQSNVVMPSEPDLLGGSGRGKSYGVGMGKGKGTIGGGKRHRRTREVLTVKRALNLYLAKPAIRRLARRAGVKRINGLVYESVRQLSELFLKKIVTDVVKYTEHARRKTITVGDVVHGFNFNGRPLYGV